MGNRSICFLLLLITCTGIGCANISTPTGGKKDKIPPKLLRVTPADSLLNTRVTKIALQFDEYITVSDVVNEVAISPILKIAPSVTSVNKHVSVKIEDSLLEENTTYRLSFGKAIKDLHESNPFSGYTYTFSTGSYFDSLQLGGNVINAATGIADTSGIVILLYKASENDSCVIRRKPLYKTKPDNTGKFHFTGLPGKSFRIYAVKDENNNLIYDGGKEMVAFADNTVFPTDSVNNPITLSLFTELPDSGAIADTVKPSGKLQRMKDKPSIGVDTNLVFSVNLDTTNIRQRTFDLTDSIKLVFNRMPVADMEKISLVYDSAGKSVRVPITLRTFSDNPLKLTLAPTLKENKVYTLQLEAGFANDTLGKTTAACRYTFRTFNDDDYGKIKLMLPRKYHPKNVSEDIDHVLMVTNENDTLYQQRITDTVISFRRLRPAKYTFRIIVDKNKNGKWDTGNLLGKEQPEIVVPGPSAIVVKAGWDNTLDFENSPKSKDKQLPNK